MNKNQFKITRRTCPLIKNKCMMEDCEFYRENFVYYNNLFDVGETCFIAEGRCNDGIVLWHDEETHKNPKEIKSYMYFFNKIVTLPFPEDEINKIKSRMLGYEG